MRPNNVELTPEDLEYAAKITIGVLKRRIYELSNRIELERHWAGIGTCPARSAEEWAELDDKLERMRKRLTRYRWFKKTQEREREGPK
jgi:hypothetical protein